LSATRAGLESPLCISLRTCVALSSTEGPVGVAIASDAMVGICHKTTSATRARLDTRLAVAKLRGGNARTDLLLLSTQDGKRIR